MRDLHKRPLGAPQATPLTPEELAQLVRFKRLSKTGVMVAFRNSKTTDSKKLTIRPYIPPAYFYQLVEGGWLIPDGPGGLLPNTLAQRYRVRPGAV